MNIKKKFLLVFLEIDSLKKDLEISKKIIDLAKPEFQKEVLKYSNVKVDKKQETIGTTKESKKHTKLKPSSNSPPREPLSELLENEEKLNLDKNHKNLYKKIASITHPDKLGKVSEFEKSRNLEFFEQARVATEERDYYTICKIAEALGLDLPEPRQEDLNSLFKTRNFVSQEVNLIRSTYPFVWFIEDDDLKKKMIVKQFIEKSTKEKV